MVRMFAAIDVTSYGLELGIYEISEKYGIRSIDHVGHKIGLWEDAYRYGKISYPVVVEVCEILSDFNKIMKSYQVEACRAYASSALENASNSQIVLDQIRVHTGIEINLLSNSEQRFIHYKAVAAKDPEFQNTIQKGTAVVSVGFVSLQISLFDKDALVSSQNLPLGVMRLREMMKAIQVTPQLERNLIRELIENEMVTFRKIYLKDREIPNLLVLGEPVTAVYYKMLLPSKNRSQISAEEFEELYEIISKMSPEQLEDSYDINMGMATFLFPAMAVIKRILELTHAQTVCLLSTTMTDGIAVEYAEGKKLIKFNHDFSNDIIATSRHMAKRFRCHMPHVQAVEALSLKVFDSLKKYHGLKARERLLLQIAAVLHSCGKFVAMRGETNCSYNIIMSTEIIGLSHVEREIVANVVHYNLHKFIYDDIKIEEHVTRNSRLATPNNLNMVIAKLTAILRLANSMDRGHKYKLNGCNVAVKDAELMITTDYSGDITLEKISIAQKADFFEEIFGIRPVLKQKKKV